MIGILIRKVEFGHRDRDMQETIYEKTEARDWSHGTPGASRREEVRKDPPLKAFEGSWPCQHLDFRLLTSGMMRQYLSEFGATQSVGLCWAALGESNSTFSLASSPSLALLLPFTFLVSLEALS